MPTWMRRRIDRIEPTESSPAIGGVAHFQDRMDHYQYTDEEFVAQMRSTSFPPALFNHEAHLRLGWVMIRTHGPDRAVELLCELIQNYARAIGEAEMYDLALTIAATRIIALCTMRSNATDFTTFLAEFPKLGNGFRELIGAYNEGGSAGVKAIL